jgi:NAD+ kinase
VKNILVIPNTLKDTDLSVTSRVIEKLTEFGMTALVSAEFSGRFDGKIEYFTSLPSSAELVLVIGGDGSVIDASRIAIELDIPLLGVNLGNLGYLSEVETDELDILKKLADGDYIVDDKMLLEVILGKSGKVSKAQRLAVNDIIVSHSEYLGIADICLENSMNEAVKYRADAVILATPAGSTAYALSSGGPIISHNLDSITATPVSPHSFFNRSIVYSANEEIKVSNIGSYSIKVSIDGRFFDSLEKGDFCIVKKSDKRFKMLTFSANNMFTTLFNKLKILSNIE